MTDTFTVTADAIDLATALTNATLFAATDNTLPVLNGVLLDSSTDGVLEIVATDRYTLGIATLDGKASEGFRPFVLPLALAKAWAKEIAKHKYAEATITADVEAGRIVKLAIDSAEWSSATLYVSPGEFPRWRGLLPDESKPADGVQQMGFNAKYLARFAKVKGATGRDVTMRMGFTSAGKPAKVTIGERFLGLIMPVRLA